MLTELILFFILITGSVFLANIFKRKYEETLIVWILGIVFLLYIFGLINHLKYGVYFIFFLTIGMFLGNIVHFIKCQDKKFEFQKFISPAMVIFYVLFLILGIIHKERLLVSWDEFSHWGDSVKVMYYLNDFITSPLSDSAFKSYPPSMTLFQYFIEVINSSFSEGLLYLSYQLIGITLFLSLFKNLKWQNFSQIIAALILIVIIPVIFNSGYYTTIYIDSILGITFGILLIYVLQLENFSLFEILKLSLGMFFLINLKDIGLFLALIIVIAIFLKWLKISKNSRKTLKKYMPLFIFIAVLIFTKATWSYELKLNNILAFNVSNINILDVFKIIFGFDNSYRQIVKVNFIEALITKPILTEFIELSTVKTLILITALFAIFIEKDKENRLQLLLILFGLYIYLFGLFVIYCFNFSEYEAVNLASFSRYISVYFIGILVFLSIYIFYKHSKKYLWILIIILLLYTPFLEVVNTLKKDFINTRGSYVVATDYVKRHIKDNSKIYIVSQQSNGYDYWVLRFSLRPNIVNQGNGWSLGKPYYDGDIWTLDLEANNFINLLLTQNYDYLYCFNCDEQFKEIYGSIFENEEDISSGNLYKIDKDNRQLKLVK